MFRVIFTIQIFVKIEMLSIVSVAFLMIREKHFYLWHFYPFTNWVELGTVFVQLVLTLKLCLLTFICLIMTDLMTEACTQKTLFCIPALSLTCVLCCVPQGAAGDWFRADCGEEMGCWQLPVPRRVSWEWNQSQSPANYKHISAHFSLFYLYL